MMKLTACGGAQYLKVAQTSNVLEVKGFTEDYPENIFLGEFASC